MGLIDILQIWDLSKKAERCAKVCILRKDGEGLSAVNPLAYQARFMENLDLITADESELRGMVAASVGMVVSSSAIGRTTF
jgi:1-phosphatidylinositol-4-phosphate 5-kinase